MVLGVFFKEPSTSGKSAHLTCYRSGMVEEGF